MYIGNLEQFKRRKVNYKSKIRVSVPKEERVICENTHEAIIDKETFEIVQTMMNKNKDFKNGTKHDHLFKGLLYCGDCGAKLYVSYSHYALKKYGEYRFTTICYTYSKLYNQCSRHSNSLPVLENLLIANIKKICSTYISRNLQNDLVKIAQNSAKSIDEEDTYNSKIETLEKQINDISLCLRNLYMDKVKNVISEEEFQEFSKGFENERKKHIKEREELIKKSNNQKTVKYDEKKIQKLAKEFISLKKPSKALLNQLIEKITISEDNEVVIYFKFKELTDISKEEENKMMECKVINNRNKIAS